MAPLIAADASVRNPAFEVEGTDTAAWRSVGSSYLILVEYIESRFARAGLPELAWFDVLAALEASEEPVRPRDLLCRVRVTKSGLTRLLDRIETEGLIRRSRCPSDRRGTFLTITEQGTKTFERMLPIREEAFRRHFGAILTEDEAKTVAEALSRVIESVRDELDDFDCDSL